MRLNIFANDVMPALGTIDHLEVLQAAERLNLGSLSDAQLGEVNREASRHNPVTGFSVDTIGALACGLERKGRQLARFITSDSWHHFFETSRQDETRWVLSKETGKLVFCEVKTRHGWRPATRLEMDDLAESLVEANEMLVKPHEFDVVMMRDMPAWEIGEVH